MNFHDPRLARGLPSGLLTSLWLAGCLGMVCVNAAETEKPNVRGDDEIRIREVFSSHLPDTMAKNSFRASIHPHFGDFDRHDYFRISNTLRYGATSKLEVSAGLDAYASHGLGDVGAFKEIGIMAMEFGAKLNIGNSILRDWDSAIGFDVVLPTGSPPMELTDGLRHFAPYVSFSRRMESRRNIRLFWGAGVDIVSVAEFPGELRDNQFDDDSVNVTAGFVIDRNMLHYSFETKLATTRVIGNGSDDDLFELRPGIIWEIPTWHDHHKRSGWMVGLGGRVSFGRDGTDFGASAKLRYNLDLKRLFARKKKSDVGD